MYVDHYEACCADQVRVANSEQHTRYNVCHQAPPTSKGFEHSCSYCGQGFTRVEELQVVSFHCETVLEPIADIDLSTFPREFALPQPRRRPVALDGRLAPLRSLITQ